MVTEVENPGQISRFSSPVKIKGRVGEVFVFGFIQ